MKVLKNLGTLGMLVAPVMVVSCGCTTASLDGDSTTENTNENPVDTNDDEVVEETTELVNKSAEELELDAFEDLWGYRPHQPLAAYPELTESLAKDLRYVPLDYMNEYYGYEEYDYSYFLEDGKQELYLSNGDELTGSGYIHGDVLVRIGEVWVEEKIRYESIYAIYYELYDFMHDREVYDNETYLTTNTDDWDYLAPYNVY